MAQWFVERCTPGAVPGIGAYARSLLVNRYTLPDIALRVIVPKTRGCGPTGPRMKRINLHRENE